VIIEELRLFFFCSFACDDFITGVITLMRLGALFITGTIKPLIASFCRVILKNPNNPGNDSMG